MVRVKAATFLYGLALLLLPFSYALKDMFALVGIHWVEPSFILGLIVFLLLRAPMRDKRALWIVVCAFLSAFVGSFLLPVSSDRGRSSMYVICTEPIRLFLSVIWFWVSIEFLILKRSFVVIWLAVSVVLQFLMAVYLYLGLLELVPLPATIALYMDANKGNQSVFFGGTEVYRMTGTFIESPPFGLFMFSCFVVFVLWLTKDTSSTRKGRVWAVVGVVVSLMGVVCSLSDQVLTATMVFGSASYLAVRREAMTKSRWRNAVEAILVPALFLAAIWYVTPRLVEKGQEAASTTSSRHDVIGMAGAERMFHTRYALGLLMEKPLAVWTGIGPGRYGDYAVRTGSFSSIVTIQDTPLLWLVEYGVFGFWLILVWFWNIAKRGRSAYGAIATVASCALFVANLSQGTWIWEAWFLALAFLYSSTHDDGAQQENLATI